MKYFSLFCGFIYFGLAAALLNYVKLALQKKQLTDAKKRFFRASEKRGAF